MVKLKQEQQHDCSLKAETFKSYAIEVVLKVAFKSHKNQYLKFGNILSYFE